MVRLRPGVPPALAERRLTEAALRVATDVPSDWSGVHLESAHERYAGRFRPVLVGITSRLACCCSSPSRTSPFWSSCARHVRQKEVALRLALGATNGRLVRLLATETCALLVISALDRRVHQPLCALNMIAPLIEAQLGRPAPGGTASIAVDTNVLFIVGAAGILAAVAFTLLPLALLRQGRLATVLQRTATTMTDGHRHATSAIDDACRRGRDDATAARRLRSHAQKRRDRW